MYNVFPIFFSEASQFVVNLRTLSSAWIKLDQCHKRPDRESLFQPMLIVSKTVFIYHANPYLGNSTCACIVFQSMYHRPSSSICKRRQIQSAFSHKAMVSNGLSVQYLSVHQSSIHQAVYSICNIAMMSPHALKQVYSWIYWIFIRLCEVDSYFFTFLQDCNIIATHIYIYIYKLKKCMPIHTICSCAVEKNVHFSCQSFMASFRASCHCPSQNSKTQKHTTTSQAVLRNATAVVVKENNLNFDKQFCLIHSLSCGTLFNWFAIYLWIAFCPF